MQIERLLNICLGAESASKWQVVFWLNAALLLYLTLTPSNHQPVNFANADKLFHFIGFGAFAFFGFLAFPKMPPWLLFVISTCLGVGVELVQAILPYRSFSVADMFADILGILTVISLLYFVKTRYIKDNQ